MKIFLDLSGPFGQSFSPIETYQLISSENLDTFIETLRTNTMISKVSALYESKDYQTVQVRMTTNHCKIDLSSLLSIEFFICSNHVDIFHASKALRGIVAELIEQSTEIVS